MSKITRREMLGLTSSLIVSHAFAGCGNKPKNQPIIVNSDEPLITIQGRILPADAVSLNKQVLYESAAEPRHLDISRDIYGAGVAINWGGEPLLRRDQNQNLVPAMAESWKPGEEVDYWDFVIRPNARWSDGVPMVLL